MRIGIPEGLLFYRYKSFIKIFFDKLGVEAVYSGESNREILERGIKNCVDEACLPMKIFHGHVSKLQDECDKVAVFRIMKCEYGESICPKFAGLPELVKSGSGKDRLAFTGPLYFNDKNMFQRSLVQDGRNLGLSTRTIKNAFKEAYDALASGKNEKIGFMHEVMPGSMSSPVIALLGHPYNTRDSFVNMNLVHKLNCLGIKVLFGEDFSQGKGQGEFEGFIKEPYWLFLRDNYRIASKLVNSGIVDGMIYVSSFCCGTDSFTIEMIRNKIGDFPMLVLKLDEHTGEAGLNTRIEAFVELLERRKRSAHYLSKVGRQS